MAQAKRKKKQALSFDDVVKSNSSAPEKKTSKVVKEIIKDVPESVRKAITKVLAGKAKKKAGESEIKVNEVPVIEFGQNLKDERAFSGDYSKSLKIEGENGDVVTFVTANKFSHKAEDEEEIEELMGEDNFDELMPEMFTITVKEEVFADPDMQKYLMTRMGDRFAEFFNVTKSRKVISTFDEELYKRFDEEKVEDIKVLVKQSKPAIK